MFPSHDRGANKFSDSGLTRGEKTANRLEYIARSIVPLYGPIDDLRRSEIYGEDYYGRDKTTLDAIISKVIKVQTWDGETTKEQVVKNLKSINYKAKNINTKISGIQNKFLKDTQELKTRLDEGRITQGQYDNKYTKLYEGALNRVDKQMEELVKVQEELNNYRS